LSHGARRCCRIEQLISGEWRFVMLKKLIVLAFVTVASPALAKGIPQTQDEWFVNSGRYLNGETPSYDQASTYYRPVVAYAGTRRHARLVEGRASAVRGTYYEAPQGYFMNGREQMVMALGA